MIKRKSAAALLLLSLFLGSGCATVQKKFTRKKKEPAHIPSVVYIEQGAYQKKYSNDYYYRTHFTLWKSWHSELVDNIGGNHKKVLRAAEESLSHLTELNQYLVPAKQAELKPLIDSLSAVENKIEDNRYSKSDESGFRAELEKIQRIVSNNFYYDKVKEQVISEAVELGR